MTWIINAKLKHSSELTDLFNISRDGERWREVESRHVLIIVEAKYCNIQFINDIDIKHALIDE